MMEKKQKERREREEGGRFDRYGWGNVLQDSLELLWFTRGRWHVVLPARSICMALLLPCLALPLSFSFLLFLFLFVFGFGGGGGVWFLEFWFCLVVMERLVFFEIRGFN